MSKGSNTEIALDSNPEARVATFIRKIYNILEEQLFPEIVDWNAEGNAIVIKKPSEFGSKVLPKYFKHNHISSFIRQLNMYSFQKKRSRHAGHIYSHELFQRGQKHLLCQIKRKIKDIFPGSAQTPSQDASTQQISQDFSTLLNENKVLKELQEKAFSKVQSLEERLKELMMQNQILQNQLHSQKQKDQSMMVSVSKMRNEGGMTQPIHMSEKVEEKSPINVQYNYNQNYTVNNMNPFVQKPYAKPEGMQVNMMYGGEAFMKQRAEALNAEKYVFSSQNSFAFNGFTNNNNKALEAVSPSTKPSPQSSKDLSPTSEHLRLPNPEWNSNVRPGINATIGYSEYAMVPSTVLKKRELDLDGDRKVLEECGIEEGAKKFLKVNPFEGHERMSLNLGDLKKFQSNLFSSWGDNKDFDQKYDGEVDLLCFE